MTIITVMECNCMTMIPVIEGNSMRIITVIQLDGDYARDDDLTDIKFCAHDVVKVKSFPMAPLTRNLRCNCSNIPVMGFNNHAFMPIRSASRRTMPIALTIHVRPLGTRGGARATSRFLSDIRLVLTGHGSARATSRFYWFLTFVSF